jgi:hypothetical protein
MSCCGSHIPTTPLTERHRFRLRYAGEQPIVVKGPSTGSEYQFSGLDRVQLVDPRDAIRLLQSGPFEMDGIVEV